MQLQNTSDGDMVTRYLQGDEKSLELLISRHKQKIFGFVYSKVFNKQLA